LEQAEQPLHLQVKAHKAQIQLVLVIQLLAVVLVQEVVILMAVLVGLVVAYLDIKETMFLQVLELQDREAMEVKV
jgi:hypothetical protein